MRRNFIAAVAKVLERTPSDAVYASFTDLMAATVALMAEKAGQTPNIVTVAVPVSLPSLVICHRHGSGIGGEADLIARNRTPHPGFMPAGNLLEVLRNARA